MLLAVDIGNSTVHFGIFSDKAPSSPLAVFSVSSRVSRSSDEYVLLISQLLSANGYDNMIDAAAVSSVAPSLTQSVSRAAAVISSSKPFIVGSGIHTGFGIKTDSPSELGADLVANAAAALELADAPILIADLGTCITISAVNSDRELIGTAIHPGINVSFGALSGSAEQLSTVQVQPPKRLAGKNSRESICSGVINGGIFLLDGFARGFREQLCENGEKLSLISTGGAAEYIVPFCRNKFTQADNLTLCGTALLYYKNRK